MGAAAVRRDDVGEIGPMSGLSPDFVYEAGSMNEMELIRRIGMASLPLLAAALLLVWAYWTSVTGVAQP